MELLVCGDNITPERTSVTVSFDGSWPRPGGPEIWEHFLVYGPLAEITEPTSGPEASAVGG